MKYNPIDQKKKKLSTIIYISMQLSIRMKSPELFYKKSSMINSILNSATISFSMYKITFHFFTKPIVLTIFVTENDRSIVIIENETIRTSITTL